MLVITGTPQKLKFKVLKARLSLPFWQTVGLLESLWLITYANAPDGDIGRLSDEEIAVALEWSTDPRLLIDALVDSRWLERHPCDCHRLLVHDWPEHCSNSHKGNYAKYGKKFAVQKPCTAVLGRSQETPLEPLSNQTNQTKPNLPTNQTGDAGTAGWVDGDFLMNGWKEVADKLAKLGAVRWKQGIAILRDQGCDSEHALKLIEFAERNGYAAPAVIHRFKLARPTLAVDAGWPPKKIAAEILKDAKQRARDKAANEAAASELIRKGRKAGKSDNVIMAELAKAGLEWPK